MYLQLIHADAWQRPTQYCKATILQLKINKVKNIKTVQGTIHALFWMSLYYVCLCVESTYLLLGAIFLKIPKSIFIKVLV